MQVYIAKDVADVIALYPYVQEGSFRALSIRDQISLQAHTLLKAHREGDHRVAMQVMSWWPHAQRLTAQEILDAPFNEEDAKLTLSREYGFSNWLAVEALGDHQTDATFEHALDLMLAGDNEAIMNALAQTPDLVSARSRYGHAATLLHYLGSNGVESHRQVTPLNAAELANLLISRGAEKNAEANMYGGGQTPYALASTSAHPKAAGISDALNQVLRTS